MQSKPLLAVSDSLGDEILLIVDRLKAGDCFELFVFALQLVYPISIRQCKETVYCWVKVVVFVDLLEFSRGGIECRGARAPRRRRPGMGLRGCFESFDH